MKAKIQVTDIPIHHIEPDPENPNEMDDRTLGALREDITKRGFVQPILVRPVAETEDRPAIRYRIIDGEHRWLTLGELGAETVPCVIDDSGETDAQIRMITMNRLRGQFVPIKLAHLLADLAQRVDRKEMSKRLSMDASELRDYLDLGDFLEPPAPKVDTTPPEPKEQGVPITVVATPQQALRIRELLKSEDEEDQAQRIFEAVHDA